MAGLSGKLEVQIEIKSPGHLFLEIFSTNKFYLPTIIPHIMKNLEVLQGEMGMPGCILLARFILDGKEQVLKELIESHDEENQAITYIMLEGELMESFKTMRITFQLVSKADVNFLKWTYEYEKMNENVPDPNQLETFITEITKLVDAHYLEKLNMNQITSA